MKKILIGAVLMFPISINASWFGPKNYDECITKNMKGVNSDYAAKAIVNSCLRMFPEAVKKEQPKQPKYFDESQLQAIRATARLRPQHISSLYGRSVYSSTLFDLTFHNNTEHRIRTITITVSPESGGHFIYEKGTWISPYSDATVVFRLNEDHVKGGGNYQITSVQYDN